ncbi:hypothetical protein NEHOM01_2381 [Nematocida homosporus]|uniref:uncharacterized protein n=1 Tax=Nematocida homosporus TaxID=1912981 RepID=UPI002220AB1E|nr:uncharacterized protein NEHOM01_2381 [Nematocida homosporus]KAI5187805.1 hypothetical protein NEHOM01_2381 [Nematocida homosporus]
MVTNSAQIPTTELSLTQIVQRIIDIESSVKTGASAMVDPLKTTVQIRHSTLGFLKADIDETVAEIDRLVTEYEAATKADKERVLKRTIYAKIEILIGALIYHEQRRQDGSAKNKQELARTLPELSRAIIEATGRVLNLAKSTTTHFPLVIHLCRCLVDLSQAFDFFVPTAYYLLYIMNQMTKIASSSAPLLPIAEKAIKVPEKDITSTVYREYVLNNAMDLLATTLIQYSTSLGFPEYAGFIIAEIKRVRNSPNKSSSWINAKIEQVAKAAKEHSERIVSLRESLSVMDEEAVKRLEAKIQPLHIDIE